jgi:hypothetical protein
LIDRVLQFLFTILSHYLSISLARLS